MKSWSSWQFAAVLLAIGVSPPVDAATIALVPHSDQELAARPVRLVARPVVQAAGDEASRGARERVVEVPGRFEWDLAADAAWQIAAGPRRLGRGVDRHGGG